MSNLWKFNLPASFRYCCRLPWEGALDRLVETRGLPENIIIDKRNGPEFACKTLDEKAYCHGVKLNFIRPGKLIENAYAESLLAD